MNNDNQHNTAKIIEDNREQVYKPTLSKYEYDLYHEEADIELPIIRVKHYALPNKGNRWKISSNNVVIFTIEGSKLSKKERNFLLTVQGFNFMLSEAKTGFTSFSKFRAKLKPLLSSKKA